MSDITATIRVESPNLALTEAVGHDDTATVRPVTGAGTAPDPGRYLFTVRSEDFSQFEAGLERDPTIAGYERVVDGELEAVYSFEYTSRAMLFSSAIAAADGVSRDWSNDGTAWTVRVWLSNRSGLAKLKEYAADRGIDFTLERVSDYVTPVEADTGLTAEQEEALSLALEMGYFAEPRAATLKEVASELGISQPAAGGRLRRGIRRLVRSSLETDSERA